jgi:MFS family permease
MNNATSPHAQRLLWAGFFSIFAAGVGFGVRGRILAHWAREYGFTQTELGEISGGGLWGFGLIIIAVAVLADRIGYGKLMIFAFTMHVLSAVLQMCIGPIHDYFGQSGVYWALVVAMVMFSFGNGTCEVVVNPMVATLFPQQKTHYLNILHAGWPGGLVTGGLISILLNDVMQVHWIVQMSMFLVPVAIYGTMMLGQELPRSEAGEAGLKFTTMLTEFAAPVLLLLLVIHALVGYVELGTDSWIQIMTGTITTPMIGTLLFTYTNILMFTLRFFAGPIEHRISPLGLLFSCAVIASIGLLLLGNANGLILCAVAVTVYGIGKTFFWPTMLAVVSERFPRGGALTLGTIGGIGMLSAGLLGAPGIGFQLDYFPAQDLKEKAPATLERYEVEKPKTFLFVFETKGLDGTKVGLLESAAKIQELKNDGKSEAVETQEKKLNKTLEELRESKDSKQREIAKEWPKLEPYVDHDSKLVREATLFGTHWTFIWTALVPATMAVLYLFLLVYFRMQGGYKRLEVVSKEAEEKSAAAPWEG